MGIVNRWCGSGLLFVALAAFISGCSNGGGPLEEEPSPEDTLVDPGQKPRIAMNGEGSGTAVWNDGHELWVRRYDAESGWEEPRKLADRDHYPDEPDVAMIREDVLVIWREVHLRIYSLASVRGWGWETVPEVVVQNLDGLDDPVLATNNFGTARVALLSWRGRPDLPPAPLAAYGRTYSMSLGLWRLERRLDRDNEDPAEEVTSLSVGMDHDGSGAAVWSQAARSMHAGWEGWPEQIGGPGIPIRHPCAAFDREGSGIAVWVQTGSVYACRYDAATENWNVPFEIEDYDWLTNAASRPHITMNGDGVAFVVWWGTAGGIYANRFANGSFGTVQRIDIALGGAELGLTSIDERPKVAVDADGHARVIWSNATDVCSVRYDARGGSWEFAERLGPGFRPDIDSDPSGRVIAVWWDDELETRVWEPPIQEDPPILWTMTYVGEAGSYKDVFTVETDSDGFRATPVNVTNDTPVDWAATLSPDGSKIAFMRNYEIWIMDANGDNQDQLTDSSTFKGEPTFTPDGTYLVYEDGPAIVKHDLEDGTVETLTDEGWPGQPSVSPDGNWLAFCSVRSLPGDVPASRNVWRMPLDGSEDPTPLTFARASAMEPMYISPAWSPDGFDIVCVRDDGEEVSEILVLDATNGAQTKLATVDGTRVAEPVYLPDGESVIYTSEYVWHEGGHFVREFWKVPADGTGSAELFGERGSFMFHASFAGKP